LKSSVEGGIKCEHCGIELMNAAITNAKIAELDGLILQKTTNEAAMTVLNRTEEGFVQLKKEFDEYEKNKLIKEKYELSVESCDLKIESFNSKLKRYFEVQDKIKDNQQIETMLIKADMRLEELETQKTSKKSEITTLEVGNTNNQEKIKNNLKLIEQIKKEEEKEKNFKIYLELFGKNGISKMGD